jgi:hypothetical protein
VGRGHALSARSVAKQRLATAGARGARWAARPSPTRRVCGARARTSPPGAGGAAAAPTSSSSCTRGPAGPPHTTRRTPTGPPRGGGSGGGGSGPPSPSASASPPPAAPPAVLPAGDAGPKKRASRSCVASRASASSGQLGEGEMASKPSAAAGSAASAASPSPWASPAPPSSLSPPAPPQSLAEREHASPSGASRPPWGSGSASHSTQASSAPSSGPAGGGARWAPALARAPRRSEARAPARGVCGGRGATGALTWRSRALAGLHRELDRAFASQQRGAGWRDAGIARGFEVPCRCTPCPRLPGCGGRGRRVASRTKRRVQQRPPHCPPGPAQSKAGLARRNKTIPHRTSARRRSRGGVRRPAGTCSLHPGAASPRAGKSSGFSATKVPHERPRAAAGARAAPGARAQRAARGARRAGARSDNR